MAKSWTGGKLSEITLDMVATPTVSVDQWAETIKRVSEGRKIPLSDELILDAKAFQQQRNFSMALLNAAIASERLLIEKLVAALPAPDAAARTQADKFAQAVGKSDLVTFLGYFYDMPSKTIALLQRAFELRNQLLHNRVKPISELEAEKAISAAMLLQALSLPTEENAKFAKKPASL
jgi:hypothetical protein